MRTCEDCRWFDFNEDYCGKFKTKAKAKDVACDEFEDDDW